jgi:hypothetical protein
MKQQVYFDAGTHLIVEEKAAIGGVEEAMLYGDYRTVDGVQLPYQIELRRGSDSYQIAVTRVQVNGVIEDRVFDFPKKSQVQLPDLAALFKKIDENQKALRKITESKDGKPLSEQEQKKQDEKTRRRIEELQKHEAKKEAKEKKDAEQGREDKNNGDPGIEVFLRACQFTNPRRERFRGQDVLVFDFAPNPEFKPRKLEEKVVQKLAGVVWIDEKALDVARLEAYFVGDMKMAGGLLANVQKGTSLVLEQAFINNEVWLPTYEEAQVGARVLLVKGFKISHVTRYSDYKKFDVQTLAATGKLKEGSKP